MRLHCPFLSKKDEVEDIDLFLGNHIDDSFEETLAERGNYNIARRPIAPSGPTPEVKENKIWVQWENWFVNV